MNLFKHQNKIGLDLKKSLRQAKSFYRRNHLHEALIILKKLKHHGYDEPEILYLTARTYDRLLLLTSEAEYEEMLMETCDEIINYSDNKKYIKKALKLQDQFVKRVSSLDENEQKAQMKAVELQKTRAMSPKAWFILGANFSVRKDPLFVINAYNNAIQLNNKYIAALFRLGYIYQYNLNDKLSALSLYLKAIKILPYEDTIESESTNVKTLIEACTEISEIYLADRNFSKTISVFDHAFRIYTAYMDICDIYSMKRVITNAYTASTELNNFSALKKHLETNFGCDFDALLDELRIG